MKKALTKPRKCLMIIVDQTGLEPVTCAIKKCENIVKKQSLLILFYRKHLTL